MVRTLVLAGTRDHRPHRPRACSDRRPNVLAPRNSSETRVIAAIDLWTKRADAAILHVSPPRAGLLAGASPEYAVRANALDLVNYYMRSRSFSSPSPIS